MERKRISILKVENIELNKIYQGNTLEILKTFPDNSIDCSISSPPYWGLRAYPNSETIWDEKEGCQHEFKLENHKSRGGGDAAETSTVGNNKKIPHFTYDSHFCVNCGAWKGQLGLEPDFKMFINNLCNIYDEIRRILKPEGTCWVNLGDTYASGGGKATEQSWIRENGGVQGHPDNSPKAALRKTMAKCLLQIPERFAIEMCDRGWILRNKIIWHKPNHMPSSVKDRLSGSWEYLYFFVKSTKYYFDLDSIRIPIKIPLEKNQNFNIRVRDAQKGRIMEKWGPLAKPSQEEIENYNEGSKYTDMAGPHGHNKFIREGHTGYFSKSGDPLFNPLGKNPGDIIEVSPQEGLKQIRSWSGIGGHDKTHNKKWEYNGDDFFTVTTQPHPFAHFAVYPERLIEMPIKAGCPPGGGCL